MSDTRTSDIGAEGTGGESGDDLFLARTVPFAFHGARLEFDLATTLFSSAGIDPGSAMLLRHLQAIDIPPSARVLDLGCGVGVLGIVLGALDRSRSVTFVDRDALACRFTLRNLINNNLDLPLMTVGGSLGYDDVTPGPPFDLIVSNIPGKAGDAVVEHLIAGAGPRARAGTIMGFVVVQPLAVAVRHELARLGFETLLDRGNRTHQVFIAGMTVSPPVAPATDGFDAGTYDRHTEQFRIADLQWRARTVTGLDEFDTLSHATKLLRGAFRGIRSGSCRILDPGQGHRAVIAARSGQRIEALVSRDLLALRATARCLEDNGLNGAQGGPWLHHGATMPSARTGTAGQSLSVDDAAETGRTSDRQVPGPRRPRPGVSVAPVETVLLHADDKAHSPWFVAEVRAQLDRWDAGRKRGGGRGQDQVAPGQAVERHLVLSGRASLVGRIEVDILARSSGHLAHKQSRAGYRVLRYSFGP